MTLKRMDNVGIVVESLDAVIPFFVELGLRLEGRAVIEGEWAGRVTGLGEQHVEIGGGVSTVRQFLEAGLIDELHVAIAPRLLGSGEHLFYGLDLTALGYECTAHVPTAGATHAVLTRCLRTDQGSK